jgi:hypothetical protein
MEGRRDLSASLNFVDERPSDVGVRHTSVPGRRLGTCLQLGLALPEASVGTGILRWGYKTMAAGGAEVGNGGR